MRDLTHWVIEPSSVEKISIRSGAKALTRFRSSLFAGAEDARNTHGERNQGRAEAEGSRNPVDDHALPTTGPAFLIAEKAVPDIRALLLLGRKCCPAA